MTEHQSPFQQQETQLSDKYEDQYDRLNKAVKQQMQVLFQFNNLLNNEYLIRKFQVDPFNQSQLVLPYEVVQRENSIKLQYVQNEQNSRKQYHLILTKILNTHNGKLWNYDDQYLIIRPFFPKERKQLYIKVHKDLKETVVGFLTQEHQSEWYAISEAPYQPDPNFIKLYVVAHNEQTAQNLFHKVRANPNVNSVIMEDIDYLQLFQTQLQEKKIKQFVENNQKRQEQDNFYRQQRQAPAGGQNNYSHNKPYRGKPNYYGNGGQNQVLNLYDNQYQWAEKNQQQAQQQVPQPDPNSYQLVRKNSSNKTPVQQFKTPKSHPSDFPALDELKSQAIV